MNEDEIERGLRGVLLAEPPLGVDPDRMVDTAVRKRRRRRAGMAAGFGVVAVAVIAASAMVVTGGGEPQPATPPKPTEQQEIDQEMARNAAHLRYVLPKLLPGAAKIRVEYEGTQPPDNRGAVFMTADITFTDSAGFAEVVMQIGSPKTVAEIALSDKFCGPSRHARTTAGKPLRCDTTTLRDRSVLHVFEAGQGTGTGPDKPIDVTELDMSRQHAGVGQVVVINHRFYVGGRLRGRYPLTEEQGVALATDPVLVMHDTGE